jgi:hypothetical protein
VMETPRRTQSSFTVKEKAAIREYYAKNRSLGQKHCARWFEETYEKKIASSTLSDILRRELPVITNVRMMERKRARGAKWPELEEFLVDFYRDKVARSEPINSKMLLRKAEELWKRLYNEEAPGQVPSFSTGWLDNFKKRNDISLKPGQPFTTVALSGDEEIRSLRTIAASYDISDVYTMAETGLYWKLSPSAMSTKGQARVTLIVCTNGDGSDKFPLWIIGRSRNPRAFREPHFNVTATRAVWTSNRQAWMTAEIMENWLASFYEHIGSRQVLLTMDRFVSHLRGVDAARPPSNVRIVYFPTNAGGQFHPLEHGVIRSLKSFYKKNWLEFMLDCRGAGTDPFASVSIRDAVLWITGVWSTDVKPQTVRSCFLKSTLVSLELMDLPIPRPDVTELYGHIIQLTSRSDSDTQDCMTLDQFLDPVEEDESVFEGEGDPDEVVRRRMEESLNPDRMGNDQENDDDDDDGQGLPVPPVPTMKQCQWYIQQVMHGYLSLDDARPDLVDALREVQEQIDSKLTSDIL